MFRDAVFGNNRCGRKIRPKDRLDSVDSTRQYTTTQCR